MLNLIAAILMNAIVSIFAVISYLKGPLVVGAAALFAITTLTTEAQASVNGYKDPIIERFGPHYSSWDVFTFYGISAMDIVGTLLAFLVFICILVWVSKRI